jgi:ABC-type phosphate/phosphonate transport system substrate-binding protein
MKTPSSQLRRQMLSILGLGALAGGMGGPGSAWAQVSAAAAASAAKKPAGGANWRLLVNEAVGGDTNSFLLTNRYRPAADFISTQLKGRPVVVEPMVDIKRFMAVAQGASKPEFVFGKSVNQLAKLVRDNGYQPVVRRADPYKAAFIVAKDSPIKTLADAVDAKVIMPDESAATSAVALAELRRQKLGQVRVTHVRFQEEVAQFVKSGMGQIGVVNPTIAKKWVEEGGRVVAETQPVVNWSVLASPSLAADMVQQLRDALLATNSESAAVMASMGVKAWAKAERKDYLDLLDYTRE